MKHHSYMLATALALPLAFGAADARAADIVETLQQQDQFSQLAQAIERAGVQDALQGEGPFTVFAPTNEAFDRLPEGAIEELDEQQLQTLLQHHVIEGERIASNEIPEQLEPMAGGPVTVSLQQGEVVLQSGQQAQQQQGQQQATAQTGGQAGQEGQQQATAASGQQSGARGQQQTGGATVVAGDIEADNGVIHGIDQVLIPQELEQQLTQAQGQQRQGQGQGQRQQGQQQ